MPATDLVEVIVTIALALIAGTTLILRGPLGKALANRLEGRRAGPDDDAAEVAELRERLQELEQQQSRMHELEERLDFAERLLAQHHDQPRLNA
jgi:flagellar motility protein MotE (MotC chaperone)